MFYYVTKNSSGVILASYQSSQAKDVLAAGETACSKAEYDAAVQFLFSAGRPA